jgi:hypothetical protein
MPALSENLEFITYTNTSSVQIIYPNTASTMLVYNSAPVKGDGYYGPSDGLHTVTYTFDPTFIGTVTMQATLATDPTEADWFNIQGTTSTYTRFSDLTFTQVDYYNFTGNFVWVRGQVQIAAGLVQVISYNH